MADEKESNDCSPLISVKEFKDMIYRQLSVRDLERDRHDATYNELAEAMGISIELVGELDEVCSPLEPDDLDEVDIYSNDIPEGVNLSTLRLLKERKGKLTHFRKEVNYEMKETKICEQTTELIPVEKVEVVLSVAIYHPRRLIKVQEFLVLSCQTLTSLRDKIHCVMDNIVPGEQSNNPDLSLASSCKDICKSGFFYFENVFYNDMRDDLNREYSRTILDWANESTELWAAKLKSSRVEKMEETLFDSLTIRLGYPYLYCHQGNCEHIVIFTDLRLLDVDDSQNMLEYPVQTFRHRNMRRRCAVCNIYTARWMTKNDILASEDPSFFCDKCFKELHYNSKGQKICDFEAYPYRGLQNW